MARIELKVQSKIKASTILEVLISMIVIMVIFGIAMMIFTNLTRSSLSAKQLSAEKTLDELLINDEKSGNLINRTMNIDGFRIEQVVQPYNGNNNLTKIDLAAYDTTQLKVADMHKIIIFKNE